MARFFLDQVITPGDRQITLSGSDAHHLGTVLRKRPGDQLVVCDSARTEFFCRIDSVTSQRVILAIEGSQINNSEPLYRAVLYQGLVKNDKMSQIVQKAVELGVSEIVPVICQRSVSVPSAQALETKLVRWNRIALEAAKQCGRGSPPTVAKAVSFTDSLQAVSGLDLALIPWELERKVTVHTVLELQPDPPDGTKAQFGIWIGPEGGFSEGEIQLARQAGAQTVTLGRRILRTETAGAAVLAMVLYRYNDF